MLLLLSLTPSLLAQETRISGRVSDVNGGAITNVKVIAVSKNGDEMITATDVDGLFKIQFAKVVNLQFTEARGFQNVDVTYCSTSKKVEKLEITMDVDPDGAGVMYSEFVCDTEGKKCEYVSRLGKGTTKPKKLTFNCLRTKHK